MEVKAMKPLEGYSAKPQSQRGIQTNPIAQDQTKPVALTVEKREPEQELNKQQLTEISQQLNKFMAEMSAGIQFTVHEKTNSLMVQVVDSKNQKVLREFPSKEFLDTIANIREYVGFLLDKKA